jgi:hypothetical protein
VPTSRDHQSRADTERVSYDRLREAGVRPDVAREAARDAAEQTHRQADRTHSDRTHSRR